MSWLSSIWNGIRNVGSSLLGGIFGRNQSGDIDWGNAIGQIGSAISSAVSNSIGPLFSAGSQFILGDRAREDSAAQAREQTAANLAAQREFAQYGVRWKAEDARQAGLHPLFAMGGSGAAFAPSPIHISQNEQLGNVGQNLGRAASAMVSTQEREARQIQLDLARASVAKDLAMAQFYDSEAARNRQQSLGSVQPQGIALSEYRPGDIIEPTGAIVRPLGSAASSWTVEMDDGSLSHGPGSSRSLDRGPIPAPPKVGSTTGKELPMWQPFIADNGFKIDLPAADDAAGALEAISESKAILAWVVGHNTRKYGPGWLARAVRQFPDIFGAFK